MTFSLPSGAACAQARLHADAVCATIMPMRADLRMRPSWAPSGCLAARYCPTVAEVPQPCRTSPREYSDEPDCP